jgi:type I restriction enzyme, S subunit
MRSIGETGQYINGLAFKPTDWGESGLPIIRIQNLTDPERPMNRTTRAVDPMYVVQPGDLLVSWSATLDAFIWNREPALLNQHIFKVVPNGDLVSKKFLFHSLRRAIGEMVKTEHLHGSTMKHINRGPFLSHRIAVPSFAEQERVVAEIEKQFSRLDEAVTNLKRVKVKIARYKAAVLSAAVTGQLLTFGGVSHRLVRSEFGLLPSDWTWTNASSLAMNEPGSIAAGPFGTIFKAKDFREDGVPIIFLRHVAPMKYLRTKPGYMDAKKWEELFRPYSVFGGELLITKLGEPPGVCAIYPTGIGPAMVTPDVIKMRVDPARASEKFLMYYFNSDVARRFATGAAFGTTRTRLTLPLFRQMPVPLPSLAEQIEIVSEVERRLSIVCEVGSQLEEDLVHSRVLKQAVLVTAFGRSVDVSESLGNRARVSA